VKVLSACQSKLTPMLLFLVPVASSFSEEPVSAETTYSVVQTSDQYPILEHHRILGTWTAGTPNELFGFKVRSLGDVDGDGIADFAVGANRRNNGSVVRAGAVDIYSTATGRLLHSYPGHLAKGSFGNGLGPAGDVNRDGIQDVAAGAYSSEGKQIGYVAVFSADTGFTHHILRSGKTGDRFGIQTYGAGDIDEDGYADVIVGAPADDSAGEAAGRAYFFSGKTGEVLITLEGEREGDAFGSAVVGDVYDGSGLIAVGAREAGPDRRGRVYVYRMKDGLPSLLFTVEPVETSRELGAYFLSFLGDVDADGVPDIYATDYADAKNPDDSGRVFVVSGRTGEILWNLEGSADFGTGSGRVGDVNQDGHADILVGNWKNYDGARAGGAALLYSGRDGKLLESYTGRFPGRTFGHDAIGIGDVDGDGTIDLLITNAGNSGEQPFETGHVYLFAGPGTRR
jgi:hypothetical protein